jgi:hypothetical protein
MRPIGGNGSLFSTQLKLEFLLGRKRTEREFFRGSNCGSRGVRVRGQVLSAEISAQEEQKATKRQAEVP